MACLLSISFTAPFCYRKANFQGTYTRTFTCRGLINPVTRSSGVKHLLHKTSVGGMILSNDKCHGIMQAPTGQCFEPVMSDSGACCSVTHVLISGFWVGPDMEDGWGFVEASVLRIY